MKSIQSQGYSVYFKKEGYKFINQFIEQKNPSKIVVLVDENTYKKCLPIFLRKLDNHSTIEVVKIEAGEEYKNIDTCVTVWETITNMGADRKSLLINLGGGVVTDLGGFVASSFKRGIDFINIPTTLLSMVDASVGGKTGVDLGVLKNQIGLFSNPEAVLIDIEYLNTLSKREFRSGLAEIIKYGFTFDISLWESVKYGVKKEIDDLEKLIFESVHIKNDVVLKDPKESGLRKVLNYGHTLGHAIESYFLESPTKEKITHGEAIAVGMITATFISHQALDFPKEKLTNITRDILEIYPKIPIDKNDFSSVIQLLKHDKKNVSGEVRFVLLNDVEDFVLDLNVSDKMLLEALDYYVNQ